MDRYDGAVKRTSGDLNHITSRSLTYALTLTLTMVMGERGDVIV